MAWGAALPARICSPRRGLTPEQRFFVGFAQWACANERPEDLRMRAQTDPHSPPEIPHQRSGGEHAGICEGVFVPRGATDGETGGENLQSVVALVPGPKGSAAIIMAANRKRHEGLLRGFLFVQGGAHG